MEVLNQLFPLQTKEVISVIGSGGKTSLIWYLADYLRQQTVLVSPTTKMGMPAAQLYDQAFLQPSAALEQVAPGITFAGCQMDGKPKVSALPATVLQQAVKHFSYILLEADGSKQLPLKGWASFEPVVPEFTTVTLAVLPLNILGKPANIKSVHRLPLFLALTQMEEGQPITVDNLLALLCHPEGIWKNAVGRQWLFFNQVETPEHYQAAEQLACSLAIEQKTGNQILAPIECCIAGSVQQGQGVNLWK